jgi:N-methylhydantoinase A
MRIGVDTGGTFTDCVVLEDGQVQVLKVFSTPDDAACAILDGVRRLLANRQPRSLDIIHGTTVGTNSVLERRGARVALITTAGFEDLLEIGRQARPRLYDLSVERQPPLVPRPLRFGVKERISAEGKLIARPSASELAQLKRRVKRSGAESLAVCCLFSFANPTNERAVVRALNGLGIPTSVSHQILPEFREYERLSTVVINAFLAPRLTTYLARLERAVGEGSPLSTGHAALRTLTHRRGREPKGLPYQSAGRIYVMQSSGGIMTAARAAQEPVRTILSGPAGGVVAAAWLAELLGLRRTVSFDMGGTSTDVCLLDAQPRTTSETTLDGLPIAIPVLDVHSVGAGGGSRARIDVGGALRVGPESAGAVPGPICYGRGGTEPTVTDANLLLGRLDPEYFLGGEFRLDLRAAERQFIDFLQRPAGAGSQAHFKSPQELARGIVAVANATMEKALRVISVERGHDPRDFTLICYGGAGGLHAADLARSLRLPRVIVPQNPGAFSALGILLADVVKDVTRSVLLPLPLDGNQSASATRRLLQELERRFERLEHAAREELRREGFAPERAQAERRLDLRYRGQSYELSVPFVANFRELFQREHEKAYGYIHPGRPLEIVNLRLRLGIPTPNPAGAGLRASVIRHADPGNARLRRRPVWFADSLLRAPFYDRERLQAGMRLAGPAVIVEYSSTTVIPPDFVCRVDKYRNLVLRRR